MIPDRGCVCAEHSIAVHLENSNLRDKKILACKAKQSICITVKLSYEKIWIIFWRKRYEKIQIVSFSFKKGMNR